MILRKVKIQLLALFLIIFSVVIGVYSQQKQSPSYSAQEQTSWMQSQLNLSEDQVKKIEAINQEYSQRRRAHHEKRDKNRWELVALERDKESRIHHVLNQDQLQMYDDRKLKEGKSCEK